MKILETSIAIDAPAQVVWAVLDTIGDYPEWNAVIPSISGRTGVGRTLDATIAFPGVDPAPFAPTIIRIVGGRELRWVTEIPGDQGYRAEHWFVLTPEGETRAHLTHCESFEGALAEAIWPMMDSIGRQAYEALNIALKDRAEAAARETPLLHPALEHGEGQANPEVDAVLQCKCDVDPVRVRIKGRIWHNHLCGCSQCWKPEGALMAQTAVMAADSVDVMGPGASLDLVNAETSIKRRACRNCGTHMVGEVTDPDHHFFGMFFVHPELSSEPLTPRIEFAGFVSSLIEKGVKPTRMFAIRRRLSDAGINSYDGFSSEIEDIVSFNKTK